jgi:NAD(P)-dependent dehydrogenase (short-subunit alcohol dehydrogenase family)
MSTIWAQELAGTGITVNILLPGGATNTGMIPDSFPDSRRKDLLDPQIMGPPAVYLASDDAREISGQRIVAADWETSG